MNKLTTSVWGTSWLLVAVAVVPAQTTEKAKTVIIETRSVPFLGQLPTIGRLFQQKAKPNKRAKPVKKPSKRKSKTDRVADYIQMLQHDKKARADFEKVLAAWQKQQTKAKSTRAPAWRWSPKQRIVWGVESPTKTAKWLAPNQTVVKLSHQFSYPAFKPSKPVKPSKPAKPSKKPAKPRKPAKGQWPTTQPLTGLQIGSWIVDPKNLPPTWSLAVPTVVAPSPKHSHSDLRKELDSLRKEVREIRSMIEGLRKSTRGNRRMH